MSYILDAVSFSSVIKSLTLTITSPRPDLLPAHRRLGRKFELRGAPTLHPRNKLFPHPILHGSTITSVTITSWETSTGFGSCIRNLPSSVRCQRDLSAHHVWR